MKVLWLAPIPLIDDKDSHPAPWIITLAKELVDHGIDLTILNYSSLLESEILKKEYQGIHLIYIKSPKLKLDILTLYQLRIKKMRNYLRSIVHDYDLLHIHGTEHQYEVMALKLDIPKLISIQGIMNEVIKVIPMISNVKIYIEWKISSFYEKIYLPKYTYFSCRTHWDSGYIQSINSQAKIYNIWEMIRFDFFDDHFSDEKKNILFVGGKSPIKGLDKLLQAFNSSLQEKGLKLIVLGNCKSTDIENMIEKHGLMHIDINNIDCRGLQNVEGMIEAYEESFCLVHPTYIDNSPNSVCEAQLSGLPVIATDVGGVASLIEDRKTGLLIGQNEKEIELAVNTLLQDDDLTKKLSEQSRKIARHRHNPREILDDTVKMYNTIISENA
ncbi:glycosyltransferase family 4 protein [Sulfurovum sp. XTW-4]|uniref:Glycosyltransferase family 4 protein n=1 Tax=Sulfurovum xiamenensis TaxID=3019066 RepID=A0ABT7QTI0_9BACT|nr:glycosyltransferase family 4 protein [Sulfurovum xiamenensis]MDM5264390.1 glycosyltransferase family 4 protein [Sulfurovum xiamenensis]